MPIIARDVVFGRLGETGMLTLRSAFEFAQARGDAHIEPIHWLSMWLRTDDCDVCMILDHLGIVREPILSDVAKALEKLRRTRSSRLDFSTELELTIERGWVSASLMFGVDRIRTGHLLHGMLETPELHRLLWDISGSFRKLEPEALVNRFGELTRGSVEEREAVAKPAPGVEAPTGASPGKPGQSPWTTIPATLRSRREPVGSTRWLVGTGRCARSSTC